MHFLAYLNQAKSLSYENKNRFEGFDGRLINNL